MPERIKVVETKKACEILGCSRQTFYIKHRPLLKQYPSIGKASLYGYDEVMALAEKIKTPLTDKYIIVK